MASHWVEYWDQRYGYGLAIPGDWVVYPTPLEGQPANLEIRNYDENFMRPYEKNGPWPEGAFKINVTVYEGVASGDTLSAAIRKILESESTAIESTQEKVAGSRTAASVSLIVKDHPSDKYTRNAFRISPDKIMAVGVWPEDARKSPDVQAILNSIVFSHQEKLIMPSIVPGALLVGEKPSGVSTDFSSPLATPTSVYTGAMNSQWVEYWDQRYGYGMAVPCHWTVYPTPLEGEAATLSMMSYDESFIRAHTDKGEWKNNQPAKGALKIDLTVFERIAPDASLEDVVRQKLTNEFSTIESVQEKALGLRQVVLAILARRVDASDKNQVIAFRISPDKVLLMSVLPTSAWGSSDVQGVLDSFAFSHQEKIVIPSTSPATVLAPVPNWCIDK
jgi:hypothetical protein